MKLVKRRDEIEGDIRTAFMRSMEDTVGDARENAPFDEGPLAASITWRWVSDKSDELKAIFGSALRYARMREKGGVIVPVRAKRLVWRDKMGKFHSAQRVVQAPGGRRGSPKHGKPYLQPAADNFPTHMQRHLG